MRIALALAALALLAAPLAAQDAPLPPWDGVWKGTIGGLPVMVCLQKGGGDWALGSYYYLSQMKPISLRRDPAGNWTEEAYGSEATTGTLQLKQSGNHMDGAWHDAKRHLPIALERVRTVRSDVFMTCGSYEYIAPRVRPVTRTVKPARVNGTVISRIEYTPAPWFEVSLATFAIPPSMRGDRAINAALDFRPGKSTEFAPGDYLSCMQGQLASLGMDGDYAFAYDLAELAPKFVRVMGQSGSSCGGVHPNSSYWWESFDRQSGKRIDLARWFTPAASPRGTVTPGGNQIELAPALRRAVLRHFRFDENDCREAVGSASYWTVGVTSKGLIFTPELAHVETPCIDDAVVPYAELTPYFSAEGKAAVQRLGLVRGRK